MYNVCCTIEESYIFNNIRIFSMTQSSNLMSAIYHDNIMFIDHLKAMCIIGYWSGADPESYLWSKGS